jgi:hypothetical protein
VGVGVLTGFGVTFAPGVPVAVASTVSVSASGGLTVGIGTAVRDGRMEVETKVGATGVPFVMKEIRSRGRHASNTDNPTAAPRPTRR